MVKTRSQIEIDEKVKIIEATHERHVQELVEDFQQRATQFQKEKDEMEKTFAMFQREAEIKDEMQRDVKRLRKENEGMAKTLAVLQAERDPMPDANKMEIIERALECICCYTIRIKIHQCTRGHIVCESCQLQLVKKVCPVCNTEYKGEPIRNLFAEDVAKTLNLLQ